MTLVVAYMLPSTLAGITIPSSRHGIYQERVSKHLPSDHRATSPGTAPNTRHATYNNAGLLVTEPFLTGMTSASHSYEATEGPVD